MTTDNHTPIPTNSIANVAVVNAPLAQLDAAMGDIDLLGTTTKTSIVAAIGSAALRTTYTAKLIPAINELVDRIDVARADLDAAQAEIDALEAEINGLVVVGGNVATLTSGAASAGQKIVTVDSSTGFLVTANVVYTLATGVIEYNQIDAIGSPTQITLTTNIGTGGIANDTYFAMISPSEAAVANSMPHAASVPITVGNATKYNNAGVYNIEAYGCVEGGTDNTTALQALIDAAWATGKSAWIEVPDGNWKFTYLTLPRSDEVGFGGGQEINFVGHGRASRLYSSTAAPMFQWEAWESGLYSGKLNLYNLFIQNTAAGGSIAKWESHDLNADRLILNMTNCIAEYFGGPNDGIHGVTAAFDIDGMIASQWLNLQINGGSPVGGGATIGWAMRIKNSSQCSFSNIYMGVGDLGAAGRGLYAEGGGDMLILGMRLDTGSRYEGENYYFYNTKGWHVHQLRGEGKDSNFLLHIKDSHNLVFYSANLPALTDDETTRHVVKIDNSNHITFYSPTIKSQDYYGNGKSIVITSNCYYVRFYRLVLVCYAGQTTYTNDIDDDGVLTMIEGSWGNAGESSPPDGVVMQGTFQIPALLVGDNGKAITQIVHATAGWDPGSIADGATESTTVTIPNAVATDTIIGLSLNTCGSADWRMRAHLYDDAGTIKAKVWLTNGTGGTVDLGSGVVTVAVARFPYTHI